MQNGVWRTSFWRIGLAAVLCLIATLILIGSFHAYATKPVFLLLTGLTIATTMLGGGVVGLVALLISVAAARFAVGPFDVGAQQRLFANLCVDLIFIALISYLQRARLAAVGRALELEKALIELRLKDTALTAAANAITITDRDGSIVWVNPAFTEMTGYKAEEVIGRNPRILKSGEQDRRYYEELWQTITSGQPWHGELVNRRKDRSTYLEELTITPVPSPETGEITNFIAIKVDVTERRRAEQALIRNEKLAATGRLAATIAHEIKNPLAAMTDLLHLVRQSVSDSSARVYLDLITSQVQAVNRIASQTLDFHRENPDPVLFSVSDLAAELVQFFQAKAKQQRIGLVERRDGNIAVLGFVGEIRQVISNLLVNAIEATPAGGKVVLHVREGRDWQTGERRGCRIFVADTGGGIDPNCRNRIFEPFFTTKGDKGTGLGLWVSVAAVQRAGGSIRFHSSRREGRSGTCFSIFLPAENADSERSALPPNSASARFRPVSSTGPIARVS